MGLISNPKRRVSQLLAASLDQVKPQALTQLVDRADAQAALAAHESVEHVGRNAGLLAQRVVRQAAFQNRGAELAAHRRRLSCHAMQCMPDGTPLQFFGKIARRRLAGEGFQQERENTNEASQTTLCDDFAMAAVQQDSARSTHRPRRRRTDGINPDRRAVGKGRQRKSGEVRCRIRQLRQSDAAPHTIYRVPRYRALRGLVAPLGVVAGSRSDTAN